MFWKSGPITTKEDVVVANQYAVYIGVASDMVRVQASVFFAVEGIPLHPLCISGIAIIDVITATLLSTSISKWDLLTESGI